MSGDYSRFTDQPRKRYSGVLMQQGRVQLDADWNEEIDLVERRWETQALDTFGPAAVPAATTPGGFAVTLPGGGDLGIGAGRLYVDGLLAEIFPGEQVDGQPVSYRHQPYYPAPDPLPAGDALVYVDVWHREVTWVEDRDLLEKALGGVDTTARRQTVWQVKVKGVPAGGKADCGADLGLPPSSGRLSSRAVAPPASDDPCILSPTGGYRGLENQLYRVEVHTGGDTATARLKWSRENASVVSPVSKIEPAGAASKLTVGRIGRDPVLRFQKDDWVEVLDDVRELQGEPGEMALVVSTDEAAQTITLDRPIPAAGHRPFGATPLEIRARHTRVRRWDQRKNVGADGLIAASTAWIPLEDGVEVQLSPAGGTLRTGDYWVFAARTVDGSVEELTAAPPRGIVHHYAQLAALVGGKVHDCRHLWPPPPCCCCTAEVGDGQTSHGDYDDLLKAVDELSQWTPAGVPIQICLLPGTHALSDTVYLRRDGITIRGCGRAARVIAPAGTAFSLVGDSCALEGLYLTSVVTAGPAAVLVSGGEARLEGNEVATAGAPAIRCNGAADPRIVRNRLLQTLLIETLNAEQKPATGSAAAGEGGLLVLGADTTGARVLGNALGPGFGDGIVLSTLELRDVLVRDNDVHDTEGSGIVCRIETRGPSGGSSGGQPISSGVGEASTERSSSDSGATGGISLVRDDRFLKYVLAAPGRIDGLRIERNTITGCVGPHAPQLTGTLPHGGIVLARVAHTEIADNRVEDNGRAPRPGTPVAGIYVRESKGLLVRDNVVVNNGPEPDRRRIPGPQGGIVCEDLSVIVEWAGVRSSNPNVTPGTGTGADATARATRQPAVPLRPDGWPAAAIQGNLVVAPRGQALVLTGIGPMQVTDNRLTARDVVAARQDSLPVAPAGAVLILNAGLPAWVSRQLLFGGFLVNSLNDSYSALEIPVVGGKVAFADNQVQLDLIRGDVDTVLAAVAIFSLDDIACQDNQTDCSLFVTQLYIDTFLLGTTLRATGNGLAESAPEALDSPALAFVSLWAAGFLMCTATSNQGIHCIIAECITNRLVNQNNLQIFCKFESLHLFSSHK